MIKINIQLFGGRGANSGIRKKKDHRPETLEERKQAARDRIFNREHNESATRVIVQKENKSLKSQLSSLEAFRENARQFNKAIEEGKKQKAAIIDFTDITGKTVRRYWNGAAYVDRASALYEKEMQGTYKAKYKASK